MEWVKTQQIRSNVELDEWVVMLNHLHGIIIIGDEKTLQTVRQYIRDNPAKWREDRKNRKSRRH